MPTIDKVEAMLRRRRIQREVDALYPEARAMNAQHDLHKRETGGFTPRRAATPECSCRYIQPQEYSWDWPERVPNVLCPRHAAIEGVA